MTTWKQDRRAGHLADPAILRAGLCAWVVADRQEPAAELTALDQLVVPVVRVTLYVSSTPTKSGTNEKRTFCRQR